jgi:hypothetical protein
MFLHPTSYPTEKEIMETPVSHKTEVLKFMKEWKAKYEDNYNSTTAMADLIFGLAKIYQKPVSLTFNSDKAYYQAPRIYLRKKHSVITALHEFAHHIYGKSEKQACRWSVWLFRKIFPREFERLEFKGHMLIKAKTIKPKEVCQPKPVPVLSLPRPKLPQNLPHSHAMIAETESQEASGTA